MLRHRSDRWDPAGDEILQMTASQLKAAKRYHGRAFREEFFRLLRSAQPFVIIHKSGRKKALVDYDDLMETLTLRVESVLARMPAGYSLPPFAVPPLPPPPAPPAPKKGKKAKSDAIVPIDMDSIDIDLPPNRATTGHRW